MVGAVGYGSLLRSLQWDALVINQLTGNYLASFPYQSFQDIPKCRPPIVVIILSTYRLLTSITKLNARIMKIFTIVATRHQLSYFKAEMHQIRFRLGSVNNSVAFYASDVAVNGFGEFWFALYFVMLYSV